MSTDPSELAVIEELYKQQATALSEARAEIKGLRSEVYLLRNEESNLRDALHEVETRLTDELSTLRARVREVVGPFANLSRTYDLEQESRRIGWTDFIITVAPSKEQCDAARQLMEEMREPTDASN